MTLPDQQSILGKLSNFFLVYSPFFNEMRKKKDVVFLPLLRFCVYYQLTPSTLSVLGLFFGVVSLLFLFTNYWFFVLLMSVSLIFDFIDGSLARYTKQVSNFGKYLDFAVDHGLMILMVLSLCNYLQSYYWLIGAAFFSVALYINVLTFSPVHIPTGRITLFLPCLIGLPQIGLFLLTLYGIMLTSLIIWKVLIYPSRPRLAKPVIPKKIVKKSNFSF